LRKTPNERRRNLLGRISRTRRTRSSRKTPRNRCSKRKISPDHSAYSLIIALITALGVESVLGAYFQARFNQQNQINQKQQELKQSRYLSILIQMMTKLNPNKISKIKKIRPDLAKAEDIDEELQSELLNAFVFADDSVVISLSKFIDAPSYKAYIKTAVSMRKDLWGKKSKIDEQSLKEFAFLENLLKE
jgi:hypothetical protein